MKNSDQLFDTFTTPSAADWKKAASAEIAGADPFETLMWRTEDELTFAPYYTKADTADLGYLEHFHQTNTSNVLAGARPWENLPNVVFQTETDGNQKALEHLTQESEGILFETSKSTIDFSILLKDIGWEYCNVSFLAKSDFPLQGLLSYRDQMKYDPEKTRGVLLREDIDYSGIRLAKNDQFLQIGYVIEPSTPINEVVAALDKGTRAIEALRNHNIDTAAIVHHIAFSMPVSSQLMIEVAKLRALRILWYQVVRSYGVEDYAPGDLYLHGRSEPWINPKFQPHGNMLKSTIACIASVTGGCNAVTIKPEEQDHTVMNRIARNTTVILRDESHLGKVSDPFAGAYSIEVITDKIAKEAWEKFQRLQ